MAKRWYYLSYYEEYPIYEPAEGGYYYPGTELIWSERYGSLRKARKALIKHLGDLAYQGEDFYYYGNYARQEGRHIGSGKMLRIETVKGIQESGWKPYS